jgi:hypothetical protein
MKAISHSKHCLYSLVYIFACATISLLLFTSIGYGPTLVSCECRVLVVKLCGGGL